MKCIIKFLCTVLLLTSIFSVPAKANAWLVLEGINLGGQGLLKIKEKLTDLNQDRKNKKRNKESQKLIIEINDEALEINPSYINTLSQEEKIRISKSYYKNANKNFKEKNIIRGCTELYQVLVIDISDIKLLKKIKKKVDKYDCTKYEFKTKKSNTDLKVVNTNIGKTLCVSKSFNADYRFSNTSCKNDEREIQKGSDEYYEAQAFIEISNSTRITSNKSKPVKKKILKKKSEVLLAKGKVKFCSNKYRVGNPAIPTIKIPSAWVGCKELSMNSYVDEKFEGYFSKKSSWGKTDKELYSLVREALISEFTRNNLDINKLYEYLPSTKYAYLESKTLVVKSESAQNKNEPSFLCSIWQTSSFKIVNKINDKSRCTDLIYKDQNINFYNSLLIYEGRVITNKQYTSLKLSKQKTKIAKVEPSQTLKVAKKSEKFKKIILSDNIIQAAKNKRTIDPYKEATNVEYCFRIKSEIIFISSSYNGTCVNNGAVNLTYDGQNYYYYGMSKDIQIANVKDSTKEEFKPKKTNQDNEAPVIEIAEVITVNDSSYEIEGSVSDNSKNIFVQVDGRTIPVKKGKFKIKRFSPIDEQIEIKATDQWGNRSSPKMVSIIIDQKDTIVADTFENLDPSKIRSRSNKNRVALIIGIEKYDQTPDATFANLDAQYFYEYARKGFGISKSNIKLLVDEDANLIQSLGTLSKWLPGKIKDGKTELIIFFAGHGLASNDGKELYLLPQDSDPDLLTRTALSRTELFKEIIALNPKSVTMFLDTCYSGVSRDEKTLLASARPIRIKADEQDTPNNFTIFSASQLDQISSGFKEAKHGIFSYYLMKGLEGKADANKDKDITNGELLAYMDENVSQKASELGRQQNPSLAGDPDKILMSYR